MKSVAFLSLVLAATGTLAHSEDPYRNNKRHVAYKARQAVADTAAPSASSASASSTHSAVTSAPAASATAPPASAGGASSTLDGNAIPPLAQITASMPIQGTVTMFTTFTAGATAPVSGAPPLPSIAIVAASYPALDTIPPTNSPEVKEWLKEIANAKLPNITKTTDGSCAGNPALATPQVAGKDGNCWWTCGGCLRDTDISVCPNKLSWGLSYDDGPSPYTPKLINYLNEEKLKATFFVVGSRVISRPEMVQAEYMLGHELSIHTWSHHPLTSLTNEEIVAELGWTRKAIKDVVGVTPNTFRPPYGDLDDRVRAIAAAMGLTPIQWTGSGATEFDTDDWKIPGGTATGQSSFDRFQKILGLATSLSTGFIVLEHDLYQQTVDLAVGYFLPSAKKNSPAFNLESINQCLGAPLANSYIETSSNKSSTPSSSNSTKSTSATGTAQAGQASTTQAPSGAELSASISRGAVVSAALVVFGLMAVVF